MPADGIEITVDTRAVEKALLALPMKMRGPAMTKALRDAGQIMLDAVVAHTPERTDEEMPNSNSLPPGILKADMHMQVILGDTPAVKVGPTSIAGHVARWQNNGWVLTSHGRSKRSRTKIRAIPGKHFLEAAFDETAETAINVFALTLADAVFGTGSELEGAGPENTSLDVDFD